MKELVKQLTALHGPSGFEQPVVRYLYERLKGKVDHIKVDTHGNIIARKKGTKSGPKVVVNAHMDEVGFIARNLSMDEVLDSYKKHGSKIFIHQAKVGLFKSVYSDKNLRNFLKEKSSASFND